MLKILVLTLPLFIACADEPVPSETAAPSTVDQTDPPEPGPGPRITRVEWHWVGCGPTATPLPFSIVVNMTVVSVDDTYEIKGQAVGCEPFKKNGQISPCTGHPAAPTRTLTVAASDASGSDTQSISTVDCADGKWVAQ